MKELRTNRADDDIKKYGAPISKDVKMDETLYEAVMNDVDMSKKGAFLAAEIYNSLNKRVSYDEVFGIFEQDTSLDFIKDIYNKKAEEITIDKNTVICHNWSDSFAYSLQKNGFNEVVVNKAVTHSQVYFKADNHMFRADATGKILGLDEQNQMSDLTRAKLGIMPQGFLIYEENSQGLMEEKNFFKSDFYKNHSSFKEEMSIHDYTQNIMKKLKEDDAFYSYEVPEDYHNVFSQIAFMSEMLTESNLDIIGGITYLKHLMNVLIPEEERKKITLDHIKMQNGEEEILNVDEIKYGLILTYAPEEVENPRCCFFHPSVSGYNFLYREGQGLNPITEEEAYSLQEKHDDIDMKIMDHDYKRSGK